MSNQTFFAGARDVTISGGTFTAINNTFVNVRVDNGNPADVLPVPQKPNSSTLFTGRRDLVDRVKNHFGLRAAGEPLNRRSFLLYGMGGIGKTQICLKFTEEMEDVLSHILG
ncbi:hypothetical protein GALMADRAFT_250171 [Galerina marginata CBS 339.88]|uniref:NB-ARC domain-containing protein n=1 Tax=Galerina marginata (strain CBS 339.88) TaxID=685588 RepID=A0A067T5N1_GALM3|nr:hypothetical protein GALMADRAFT_250171 [Galerina marginata CBS 339.88]